jgi:transcriptional regulator of arginine metabolism
MSKKERQAAILELVRARRVRSQEEMRHLLERRGHRATQATLSRDLRELRIVKVPGPDGRAYYTPAVEPDEPDLLSLEQLVPQLVTGVQGVDNLLIVKTLAGGAQTIAEALDLADWPEVVGTVAGDDTILVVLQGAEARPAVVERLEGLQEG